MKDYYKDSYVTSFSAVVVRKGTLDEGRMGVVLDQTYFYPTSGGQPNDLGTIGGIEVLDVVDGDEVLHILKDSLNETEVQCEIDWKRRFDHMQQHAGQHILSAVFEKLYDAETVGFHLGEDYVTIDVTLDSLTMEMADRVEEAANALIYKDLPISSYIVSPEKLKQIPLRKPPVVDTDIRIVEIAGEDYSACGGTHPKRTGEVGLIKIRKWEKNRENTRVEFVCGLRALRDYQWKNQQINEISNQLSCRDQESLEGFQRLYTEGKELRKELRVLRDQVQRYTAEELYQKAPEIKGIRLITQIFTDRNMRDLKKLANKIIAREKVIVLFGVRGEKAQISFSSSQDVSVNMNELLQEVIGLINGGGGGNAHSAQGGGSDVNNLDSLLQAAQQILKNRYLV